MIFANKAETSAWLSQKCGLSLEDRKSPRAESRNGICYSLPVDSGQKTFLARCFAKFIKPNPEALLWIAEWGVWTSAENIERQKEFEDLFQESKLTKLTWPYLRPIPR